jgi:hypothetical protein
MLGGEAEMFGDNLTCEDLVVRRSRPYGYETGDQPALS